MSRIELQRRLARAITRVGISENNVARQRRVAAELERDGHDVTQAKEILAELERAHALQVADRDRLERELAALDRQ
jgi:hypothetical protein